MFLFQIALNNALVIGFPEGGDLMTIGENSFTVSNSGLFPRLVGKEDE